MTKKRVLWLVIFLLPISLLMAGIYWVSGNEDINVSANTSSLWPPIYLLLCVLGLFYYMFVSRYSPLRRQKIKA